MMMTPPNGSHLMTWVLKTSLAVKMVTDSEQLDQEESDQNHVAGEQCMDRLANKLGGQAILAPTFNWLPRMMNSTAWRDRHAALMAISAISEGCRELMIGELQQVLNLVGP